MPAAQDLRQVFAQAQIDWVVEPAFAPLLRCCSGLRRVIECDLRRWRRAPLAAGTRTAWRAFCADLQSEAYDRVLDLQGLSKSALVAWLARLAPGGQRVALANRTDGSSYEAPTRWVADQALLLPRRIGAVDRSRTLCAKALGYQVPGSLSFGLLAQPSIAAQDRAQVTPAQPRPGCDPLGWSSVGGAGAWQLPSGQTVVGSRLASVGAAADRQWL